MIISGVISETIGMLPAMKITEPYSPTARANASAKPVASAGSTRGQHDAPEDVASRSRRASGGILELAVQFASTGCTVRTTNGRPMKASATTMPSRRVRDLDAERLEQRAEPAVRRVQRGQRDARDRRRQRERQVDDRIDEAAARELVPHQHPGDDEAEHAVERAASSEAPKLSRYEASTRGA